MKKLTKALLVMLLLGSVFTASAQKRHDIAYVSDIPEGRNILIQPHLGKVRPASGKISIGFTIDWKGNVIAAKADPRATTITNRDLIAKYEQAVREAKFSKLKKDEANQHGVLTYNFD
ncbi:hypothetical protein GCM10027049_26750 [Mucilaginibacter puniceus]